MLRKSFARCQSGNVMIIFVLALIPVLGSIGLAVDYSQAVGTRYKLQNAIDATALSLAHARIDLTQKQLEERAVTVFKQNFITNDQITLDDVNVERGKDFITVDAAATMKTSFSRVLNIDNLDVSSKGKVVWGPVRVEVVMALDNTLSMDEYGPTVKGQVKTKKIDELKKAAKKLVDTLEDVATNEGGSVKIGIAPFGSVVRVNPASTSPINYKTATWINFPDYSWQEQETYQVCERKKDRRGNWYDDCHNETRTVTKSRAFDKANWRGCIDDRDKPYDTNDTVPTSTATRYTALEKCDTAPRSVVSQNSLAMIRPLATDFAAMDTFLTNMTPAGATNVTIGVQWGTAMLSHTEPFTQGVNPANELTDGKTQKVLILLTDGENTESRYQAWDQNNGWKTIDPRTELACTEAKKIAVVYAIRVIEGNDTLLKKCATDSTKYYDVQDASKLTPVFQQIADEISKLRVAS